MDRRDMIDPAFQKWWFLQDEVPEFQDALWRVYAEHRDQLLQSVFRRNKSVGSGPVSFQELGALLRQNGNHLRKGHGIPIPRLPAWADLLGVEISELYPSRIEWLVKATRRLSRDLQASESDVVLYVHYLLADPMPSGMNEHAVRQVRCHDDVRRRVPNIDDQQIRDAVRRVADQLRPLLTKILRRAS